MIYVICCRLSVNICIRNNILLDFSNRKVLCQEHRSLSFSLYIFPQSHAESFLKEPNILHNIINYYKILYNHSSLYVQGKTPSISQAIPHYCLCKQLAYASC